MRTSALPSPSVSQEFRDDVTVVSLTAVTLSPLRLVIHIVSELSTRGLSITAPHSFSWFSTLDESLIAFPESPQTKVLARTLPSIQTGFSLDIVPYFRPHRLHGNSLLCFYLGCY